MSTSFGCAHCLCNDRVLTATGAKEMEGSWLQAASAASPERPSAAQPCLPQVGLTVLSCPSQKLCQGCLPLCLAPGSHYRLFCSYSNGPLPAVLCEVACTLLGVP